MLVLNAKKGSWSLKIILCGYGAQYGKNKFSVRIMIILVLFIGDTKDDSQDWLQ